MQQHNHQEPQTQNQGRSALPAPGLNVPEVASLLDIRQNAYLDSICAQPCVCSIRIGRRKPRQYPPLATR